MIDFEEIEIAEGHVHILSPGQIHYMHRHPASSGWVLKFTSEFFISASFDTAKQLPIPFLNNSVSASVIRPDENSFAALMQLVDHIREEYQEQESGFQEVILNYVHVLLLKCRRLESATSSIADSAEKQLFHTFQQTLEAFFKEENRVTFYAKALAVSNDKLNQVVKSVSGSTPGEMIASRLLLEAKRWLLHSEKSIKEVAYLLNFQDNAYFNRWFKKRENCSPGEFRTASREKYHE